MKCYVIAEIGINHNGGLEVARGMIDVARSAGCDAVKFQKRTVESVYSPEELAKPRDSVYGKTNGDLKRGLEFGLNQYADLAAHCEKVGIEWGASVWDETAVGSLSLMAPDWLKLASPTLTSMPTLAAVRAWGVETKRPVLVSTGMSTICEVDEALKALKGCQKILMHCVSAYPLKPADVHLEFMDELKTMFGFPVGYSGHTDDIWDGVAAAARGAACVEKHVTLDRAMWGSDQALSIEPHDLRRMVSIIREVEQMTGREKKRLLECEVPALKKLRR